MRPMQQRSFGLILRHDMNFQLKKANADHSTPLDKVVTLFNQGHIGGSLDVPTLGTGLGGIVDGTLREYGTFDEQGLVHMPSNLNWLEASTLSCAALTAWNALYGLETRALKPGQTVLTQGTGGVSIFALQVCLESVMGSHQTNAVFSSPKLRARESSRRLHHRRRLSCSRSTAPTTSLTTKRTRTGVSKPRA